MKVISTYTFCRDNLRKSIMMALEKTRKLGIFSYSMTILLRIFLLLYVFEVKNRPRSRHHVSSQFVDKWWYLGIAYTWQRQSCYAAL